MGSAQGAPGIGVAQSNTSVAESHLKIVSKKEIKKDSEEIEPATEIFHPEAPKSRCPTRSRRGSWKRPHKTPEFFENSGVCNP
jgi:hypothetical protein